MVRGGARLGRLTGANTFGWEICRLVSGLITGLYQSWAELTVSVAAATRGTILEGCKPPGDADISVAWQLGRFCREVGNAVFFKLLVVSQNSTKFRKFRLACAAQFG